MNLYTLKESAPMLHRCLKVIICISLLMPVVGFANTDQLTPPGAAAAGLRIADANLPFTNIVPVVTPLDSSGRADQLAIGRYLDLLKLQGVTHILAVGATGEGHLLPWTERCRANRFFIQEAKSRGISVFAHVSGETEDETVQLLKMVNEMKQEGYPVAGAVIAPLFYLHGNDEIEPHVLRLRAEVPNLDMPLILYSNAGIIPDEPGRDREILPAVAGELYRKGRVAAIKGSCSFAMLREYIATGIPTYVGSEEDMLKGMYERAAGTVGSTGSIWRDVQDLADNFSEIRTNEDEVVVKDQQAGINRLRDGLTCGTLKIPACLKAALSMMGICSTALARGNEQLTREEYANLIHALADPAVFPGFARMIARFGFARGRVHVGNVMISFLKQDALLGTQMVKALVEAYAGEEAADVAFVLASLIKERPSLGEQVVAALVEAYAGEDGPPAVDVALVFASLIKKRPFLGEQVVAALVEAYAGEDGLNMNDCANVFALLIINHTKIVATIVNQLKKACDKGRLSEESFKAVRDRMINILKEDEQCTAAASATPPAPPSSL